MFAHPDPQGGPGIGQVHLTADEIDRRAAELAHAEAEKPDPSHDPLADASAAGDATVINHETPQQADPPAEQAATSVDPPADAGAAVEQVPADLSPPIEKLVLVYGATGDEVDKLVNLLKLLGYSTNDYSTSQKLDESVLVDVRAAQAELGIKEKELSWLNGEFVGNATRTGLYEAAEAKLETQG